MVKIYKQPFAHDGDTIAIPDASQPDGKMSNADGWTPDYQLPKTDPNYKPVGRQEMNGVFKEVTEALGQMQVQGAASWSADGAPYPINAQVYHNGKQWIALRENSVEPAEGDDWNGALRPATPEQAQALTAGDAVITPETLAAAFGGGNQGLTVNGYQKLPGGLIIQWGAHPYSGGTGSVTFPIAFPTDCYSAQVTRRDILIPTGVMCISSLTATGFTVSDQDTTANNILWFAVGK